MTRQQENRELVIRLLYHAGFDVDRFEEKQKDERKQKLNSPVERLRNCLRNQLIIDKFEKVRKELMTK